MTTILRFAAERARRAPPGDTEPPNRALYDEYARGFDEIPILDDVVRSAARPPLPPSFVRGERRNLRKTQREDAYTQRESALADLERHYQEYVAPPLAAATRTPPRKRRKRGGRDRKRR
jgi:hypothetical protein